MRILVVEDEIELCESIAEGLRMDGYAVDTCNDGEEALELVAYENFDLIVLNLNLPGADGMEILENLRKHNEEVKVLILSARCYVEDRVAGLDMGANDYLTKPFHFEELEARIRNLLRRKFIQKNSRLSCGELTFDTLARTAFAGGSPLSLTRKETALFEYLMLNQDRPVSQEEFLEHLWDGSVNSFSNSIRVHMSSLRKKIKAAIGFDPIRNKVGEGYILSMGEQV